MPYVRHSVDREATLNHIIVLNFNGDDASNARFVELPVGSGMCFGVNILFCECSLCDVL